MSDFTGLTPQAPSILRNLDKYIKDEMEASNIPLDARLAVIDTFDLQGNKLTVAIKIKEDEKRTIRIVGMWNHDWDGDDTVAAKLVFVRK